MLSEVRSGQRKERVSGLLWRLLVALVAASRWRRCVPCRPAHTGNRQNAVRFWFVMRAGRRGCDRDGTWRGFVYEKGERASKAFWAM